MLIVIQEREISLFSESSEWEHLSQFEDMISVSSDNGYLYRHKNCLYILLPYFAVWKGKLN